MPPLTVHSEPDFRAEVARLRSGERRRMFPAHVHIGLPAGPQRRLEVPWPAPEEYDAGLLFDLADALLDAFLQEAPDCALVWAWLTRPGVAEVHDCDLGWFSAVLRAFGAHRTTLGGFRVVTRSGWLDPATGASRTWKRLRT
jgi:hypothetical protein